MLHNQPITYPVVQVESNIDELSMIRKRRAVKRLRKEQDFASWLFKIITISSIFGGVLFGIGALACWKLEIDSQPIPVVNNRLDWQVKKQRCLGWMLISFSSFFASAWLGKKSKQLKVMEKVYSLPNINCSVLVEEQKRDMPKFGSN